MIRKKIKRKKPGVLTEQVYITPQNTDDKISSAKIIDDRIDVSLSGDDFLLKQGDQCIRVSFKNAFWLRYTMHRLEKTKDKLHNPSYTKWVLESVLKEKKDKPDEIVNIQMLADVKAKPKTAEPVIEPAIETVLEENRQALRATRRRPKST